MLASHHEEGSGGIARAGDLKHVRSLLWEDAMDECHGTGTSMTVAILAQAVYGVATPSRSRTGNYALNSGACVQPDTLRNGGLPSRSFGRGRAIIASNARNTDDDDDARAGFARTKSDLRISA